MLCFDRPRDQSPEDSIRSGWGAGSFLLPLGSSAANRAAFTEAITNPVSKRELDRVDFEWAYTLFDGLGAFPITPLGGNVYTRLTSPNAP